MMLCLLISGIFMVNKTSPGGRGGGKKIKKVSIFFQKRGIRVVLANTALIPLLSHLSRIGLKCS